MTITVAYDVELLRVGCALIQAATGATIGNADLMRFDDWLTAPTPGLRLYETTEQELESLIAITNRKGGK